MESEYGCWLNYGNGGQLQSTWLQSKLSDLEENTKSMLSLIKLENGDSFAERAEMYYQKKPELEKRIAKYQQLYRLLLDHYSPILARSSISSISTVSNFENNSLRNSLKIESSNSNPESCVEDLDQGMQEKIMPKLREINPKKLEIEMSNLKLNTELCEKNISSPKMGPFNSNTESFIEEIYLETQEKNIPKIGEIGEKIISKLNGISPKKINGNIFERLVDFEKRMSCSEELVEDNKRHVDELTRRYEETHKLNKMLAEQLAMRMKDIEFLHNENLRLLSEKRLKKEKKRAKFWRKISIKRLKGLVKRKGSIKQLKDLVKSACLWRK